MKKNLVRALCLWLQFGAAGMTLAQTLGTDGCPYNSVCTRQPPTPASGSRKPVAAATGGTPVTGGSVPGTSRADAIRNTANMFQQMLVTPATDTDEDDSSASRERALRANARAEAEAREAQRQKALESNRARAAAAEAERQRRERDVDGSSRRDDRFQTRDGQTPDAAGNGGDVREAMKYAIEARKRLDVAERALAKCNQRAQLTMVPGDDPGNSSACQNEAADVDKYRSYTAGWNAEGLKRAGKNPAFIEERRQADEQWRKEELRRRAKAEKERQLTRAAEEQKQEDEAAYAERHSLRNTVRTMVDSTVKGSKEFINGMRSDINRVKSCADDPFGDACTPAN